jgi:hypothetical protein
MWWMRGYCARGWTCHFRHDDGMAGVQNKNADADGGSEGKGEGSAKAKVSLPWEGIEIDGEWISII